jgi:hypothetical protein
MGMIINQQKTSFWLLDKIALMEEETSMIIMDQLKYLKEQEECIEMKIYKIPN